MGGAPAADLRGLARPHPHGARGSTRDCGARAARGRRACWPAARATASWWRASCERFGLAVVRGSSSRGGAQALRALAAAVRAGEDVAVVPDGPRGPRERVQPGVVALAATHRRAGGAARLRGASRPAARTRGTASWCRCRSRARARRVRRGRRGSRATPTARRRARASSAALARGRRRRGRSPGRARDVRRCTRRRSRRRSPATRRWRCCAASTRGVPLNLRERLGCGRHEPPAAAVRLDPRGLGRRGDRRRAPRARGCAGCWPDAAARRDDGDGDRRRASCASASRASPRHRYLAARSSRAPSRRVIASIQPGLLHLHGDGAVAEPAAHARRAAACRS